MSGPLGFASCSRPWNKRRDSQRRQLLPWLQRVESCRRRTAVPYHNWLGWDKPTGPSSAIGPFGRAVDVADNAAAVVVFATLDSRESAGVDVEIGGIAKLLDSVGRSP